uniref:Uncharacterized protein n=1 Tax=Rhizophora mucronata TaxID=61149 RepID=A0A2P2JME5_RHIMU
MNLRLGERQASIIMNENDAMIDILLRLPLRSLLQCRCVCKWWKCLISDPIFISNYSCQNPELHSSGFFIQKFLLFEPHPRLEFVACKGEIDAAPEPSLSFIEDDKGVCIQHSCNGLLLCSSFRCHEEDRKYYVCKPTTKQCWSLPKPSCKTVFGTNIIYDPCVSLHYKIICVCDSELSINLCEIKIYDSAMGAWRTSRNLKLDSHNLLFNRGVFWNGALHWIGREDLSFRFHIEREVLLLMRKPPIPEGGSQRRLEYFGESGGHLYLIEIYGPETTIFNVMEMERDYSSWFVKYRVDLARVASSFASMIRYNVEQIHRHVFSVLHLVDQQAGDNDESYLVLHIPGKLVSFNLEGGNFTELDNCSFQICGLEALGLWYSWEGVYLYTNTFYYL